MRIRNASIFCENQSKKGAWPVRMFDSEDGDITVLPKRPLSPVNRLSFTPHNTQIFISTPVEPQT